MKAQKFILTCLFIATQTLPVSAMTFVGLDEGGAEVIREIPNSNFNQKLKHSTLLVYRSTHAALEEHTSSVEKSAGESAWDFKRFEIGLGFKGTFGIGSLIKASVNPAVRLMFVKQ